MSDDTQPVPNVQTGKMTKELIVNGITREYIIYIPESYTGTSLFHYYYHFMGLQVIWNLISTIQILMN